jgi:hypothetical protein
LWQNAGARLRWKTKSGAETVRAVGKTLRKTLCDAPEYENCQTVFTCCSGSKTFVKSAIKSKFLIEKRFEIGAPETMQTFCKRSAAFEMGVLPACQKRSRIIARIMALKSRMAKFMGESVLSPFCEMVLRR